MLQILIKFIFSRDSSSHVSVHDKKCVGGPIADQSQSVVRASVDCSSPTGTLIEARPYTAMYSSLNTFYHWSLQ